MKLAIVDTGHVPILNTNDLIWKLIVTTEDGQVLSENWISEFCSQRHPDIVAHSDVRRSISRTSYTSNRGRKNDFEYC